MRIKSLIKIFLTFAFIISRTLLVFPHSVDAKDLKPVFTRTYISKVTKLESDKIKKIISVQKNKTQIVKEKRLRRSKKFTIVQTVIQGPLPICIRSSGIIYQTVFSNLLPTRSNCIDRPPC
jgi:hypothetical protein